jgi:hypothetical protein
VSTAKIWIAPDLRQKAELQDVLHVEVEIQFASREREALAVDGSSGQQIHVQPLELTGARAAPAVSAVVVSCVPA